MTTKSVTTDFNDGQIIKSGLPNDRIELPSISGGICLLLATNWRPYGKVC